MAAARPAPAARGYARAFTLALAVLSSGEIGLAQHMAEVGKQSRAGQELRLAEIPADAGKGLGLFENLHESNSGAEFAKALDHATRQHYGTAWVGLAEAVGMRSPCNNFQCRARRCARVRAAISD
jgi:putative DNA primase/helicase